MTPTKYPSSQLLPQITCSSTLTPLTKHILRLESRSKTDSKLTKSLKNNVLHHQARGTDSNSDKRKKEDIVISK